MITDQEAKDVISENVQRLLDARDWTQRDLAVATKESTARINHLVNGRKCPSAAFLARVAEALDVTPNDLLVS